MRKPPAYVPKLNKHIKNNCWPKISDRVLKNGSFIRLCFCVAWFEQQISLKYFHQDSEVIRCRLQWSTDKSGTPKFSCKSNDRPLKSSFFLLSRPFSRSSLTGKWEISTATTLTTTTATTTAARLSAAAVTTTITTTTTPAMMTEAVIATVMSWRQRQRHPILWPI